ncbi:MAG: hypothetical protein ABIH39_04555 [Candidatus Margulisiibacteriota bacterium]
MGKLRIIIGIIVFLCLTLAGQAEETPSKLVISNRHTTFTAALVKEQLYRARFSSFYNGEFLYNLYYGIQNRALEISTGHNILNIANGLVISDAQYREATIISGRHNSIDYQAGVTPLFSFYEIGLNNIFSINYLDENKERGEMIVTGSHRTIWSIKLKQEIVDNLFFYGGYAVSNIAATPTVTENAGIGVMLGGEYQNISMFGMKHSIGLFSYAWNWDSPAVLDPYSPALYNNRIDRGLSELKDRTGRLTVLKYNGELQVENTEFFLQLKQLLDGKDKKTVYNSGINYKVREIAGLGLSIRLTNAPDIFSSGDGPVLAVTIFYVENLGG